LVCGFDLHHLKYPHEYVRALGHDQKNRPRFLPIFVTSLDLHCMLHVQLGTGSSRWVVVVVVVVVVVALLLLVEASLPSMDDGAGGKNASV
jgi:hypothetical protein